MRIHIPLRLTKPPPGQHPQCFLLLFAIHSQYISKSYGSYPHSIAEKNSIFAVDAYGWLEPSKIGILDSVAFHS